MMNSKLLDDRPIGIFDSGVGGLSVWKEIVLLMPWESTIYYADSKNCPYGPRSQQKIIDLCEYIVEFLLFRNCKLIVVACNTATAAAIDYLRCKYSIPFVGMEPAVKPAALGTKTGCIGVLATEGTFNGRLFKETSKKYATDVKMVVQIGKGLAELVEKGEHESPRTRELLATYIEPILAAGADHLVLGCTHYPFLIKMLQDIALDKLTIINPSIAVGRRVMDILGVNKQRRSEGLPHHQFYTSGEKTILKRLLNEMNFIGSTRIEQLM